MKKFVVIFGDGWQVGDDSITRPWSKYSEGSSANDRQRNKEQPETEPVKFGSGKVKARLELKKSAEQEVNVTPWPPGRCLLS